MISAFFMVGGMVDVAETAVKLVAVAAGSK